MPTPRRHFLSPLQASEGTELSVYCGTREKGESAISTWDNPVCPVTCTRCLEKRAEEHQAKIEENLAKVGFDATPEEEAHTALTQKQHSPLVIRKFTRWGFPIYVALITDDNLNTLDHVVHEFMNHPGNLARWRSDKLQDKRNLAGLLSNCLVDAFEKAEGVAVILYVDKTCVSSLHGDFMNHGMCRTELYTLLMMGTQV